jgi:hypothetical protein
VSDEDQFRRIRLVARMESDREVIREYRKNEQFYINRLVDAAHEVGALDERLRDDS